MTNTAGIPGDRICSFIERVERIDEEIKALNEGKKEVFAAVRTTHSRPRRYLISANSVRLRI
jgi:uncharacterized protein (UPF0335 family)